MEVIKEAEPRYNIVEKEVREGVASIIEAVRTEGETALKRLEGFYGGNFREELAVSREEIEAAYAEVNEQEIRDIREAASNIRAFAEAQRATIADLPDFCPAEGIHLGHRVILF